MKWRKSVDGTTMHADADEATGELVHDHEQPVTPKHDGLAAKKIHAPQAVEHRILENRPVHGKFQNAEEISDSSCTGVSGTEKRRYADSDIA